MKTYPTDLGKRIADPDAEHPFSDRGERTKGKKKTKSSGGNPRNWRRRSETSYGASTHHDGNASEADDPSTSADQKNDPSSCYDYPPTLDPKRTHKTNPERGL